MIKITAQAVNGKTELDITVDGKGMEVMAEAFYTVKALMDTFEEESEEAMMGFINVVTEMFKRKLNKSKAFNEMKGKELA